MTETLASLLSAYEQDKAPTKINMLLGQLFNEKGEIVYYPSVAAAERLALANQRNKSYQLTCNNTRFNENIESIYYENVFQQAGKHGRTLQISGGSAALMLAFELIANQHYSPHVFLPGPYWGHYKTMLNHQGVAFSSVEHTNLSRDPAYTLHACQSKVKRKTKRFIILQLSCHNPTGLDMSSEVWQSLCAYLAKQRITPIVDCAYLGYTGKRSEELQRLQNICEHCEIVYLTTSLSKTLTLYSDRVGAFSLISNNNHFADQSIKLAEKIAFARFFAPAAHGSKITDSLFRSPALYSNWNKEIEQSTRALMNKKLGCQQRGLLVDRFGRSLDKAKGLFSLLPLSHSACTKLREQFAIYLPPTGRMNFSALNTSNTDYFCEAVLECTQAYSKGEKIYAIA